MLYTSAGTLKIADFGLARSFADPGNNKMTSQVITRWYRPPELLFSARSYSSAVDVFSLGAVFAELILRVPFLPGDTDLNQLATIANALGTPSEANWPGVTGLPGYVVLNAENPQAEVDLPKLKRQFSSLSASGVELLHGMLRLDPRKRTTARRALDSHWFREEPLPTPPHHLPGQKGKDEVDNAGQDIKRRAGWDESLGTADLGAVAPGRGKKAARRLNFGV